VREMTQKDLEREVGIRRRLLDAATEVFLEDGPRDASLDKIAERAEVDLDTLLVLYPTRFDLMTRLVSRLYTAAFPFEGGWRHRSDLAAFLRAYLQRQQRPEVRLVWHIGDVLAPLYPDRVDAAYWHLAGELELRLLDTGLAEGAAHECSLVLTPALMLVARRAAFDLTTQAELRDFVAAACSVVASADSSPPPSRYAAARIAWPWPERPGAAGAMSGKRSTSGRDKVDLSADALSSGCGRRRSPTPRCSGTRRRWRRR
jgi:AcrR family transcriptional regulator